MDIYAEVTNRIIEQMEQGEIPWEKPWVGSDSIVSHATGKGYSLLNQILIGKPGEYITYNQTQKEGGKVKKGSKSKLVVFWTILEKEDEGETKKIPYLKYSRVFNIEDCEGIKPRYIKETPLHDNQDCQTARNVLDSYITREGILLEHSMEGGAYYQPMKDRIHLPELNQFCSTEAYYDTAFHECVHSTGHSKRLNRGSLTSGSFFGNTEYSKEELVAEIGACAIVHMLGLETKSTFRNNTAYIQNWLKALKDDRRMLVSASTAAYKAVNYIMGGQNDEV